jgi:hypothetical protein
MAVPGKGTSGYRAVADLAWERLGALQLEEVMARAGAEKAGGGVWKIPLFGRSCTIHMREMLVLDHRDRKAGVTVEIVLLHYILGSRDVPLSGDLKSFREFEGAEAFQDAFRRRVIEPLAQTFGPCPERFASAARELGGIPAGFGTGDFNFRIPALPRLPVVCILWLGDDEVRPSAQVLFDGTASSQVHVEDLAVVGEFAAFLLMEAAGLESDSVGRIFSYG